MRLFLYVTAFALACAAAVAAQSGRVKRSEPAAQPTPEQQTQQREAGQEGSLRLLKGEPADDAEPERDGAGERVYLGRQVDRRARLLSRPEPEYTRRARRNRVKGVVVLRAVLAASGKVEKISVVKELPEGLTEEAIKAARLIKFEPAEREGRKVSQSVVIEYHFDVY